jgi:2'-5' RNA ligase
MSRLFIALSIPDEVKAAIENAQGQFRGAVAEGAIRWTKRDQLHLTLKFLGNVDEGQIEALAAALRHVCQGFAPLRLRAERIGAFPNLRRPRVLWVGVEEARDQLAPLQRSVKDATRLFTVEEAEEKFSAHVTLARIKQLKRDELEALTRVASGLAETFFGEWTANEIELIQSELSSARAKHTVLRTFRLVAERHDQQVG